MDTNILMAQQYWGSNIISSHKAHIIWADPIYLTECALMSEVGVVVTKSIVVFFFIRQIVIIFKKPTQLLKGARAKCFSNFTLLFLQISITKLNPKIQNVLSSNFTCVGLVRKNPTTPNCIQKNTKPNLSTPIIKIYMWAIIITIDLFITYIK